MKVSYDTKATYQYYKGLFCVWYGGGHEFSWRQPKLHAPFFSGRKSLHKLPYNHFPLLFDSNPKWVPFWVTPVFFLPKMVTFVCRHPKGCVGDSNSSHVQYIQNQFLGFAFLVVGKRYKHLLPNGGGSTVILPWDRTPKKSPTKTNPRFFVNFFCPWRMPW